MRTIVVSLVVLVAAIALALWLGGRSARRFAAGKHRHRPVAPPPGAKPDHSAKPRGHRRT